MRWFISWHQVYSFQAVLKGLHDLHKVAAFRDWLLDIARGSLMDNVTAIPITA